MTAGASPLEQIVPIPSCELCGGMGQVSLPVYMRHLKRRGYVERPGDELEMMTCPPCRRKHLNLQRLATLKAERLATREKLEAGELEVQPPIVDLAKRPRVWLHRLEDAERIVRYLKTSSSSRGTYSTLSWYDPPTDTAHKLMRDENGLYVVSTHRNRPSVQRLTPKQAARFVFAHRGALNARLPAVEHRPWAGPGRPPS